MSKGFDHNPLVDIERIRQDLKDRYPDDGGFVILKELIQNAEDAGAQRFVVSWTPGLPNARHPLLRGPAIVAANDGPFKDSDSRAIRRLGLSEKLTERGSIGKFGLGLKSVFHWCEAFCYVYSNGASVKGDILNPWSGPGEMSYHSEWDAFGEDEVHDIRSALDGVISAEILSRPSWFSLWIPLRRRGVCAGRPCASLAPLRDNVFPGDAGTPEHREPPSFLQSPALPRRLAETLPLLVSVTRVQVRRPDGQQWITDDIISNVNAKRRYRRGDTTRTFECEPVTGTVRLPCRVLTFRGRESLLAGEGEVAAFRRSPLWPKGARESRATGTVTDEPDKAGPHGAAVFFGQVDGAGSSLEVSWATFLPLGEPLTRSSASSLGSAASFHLFLHGDFFVDPGRRGPNLPRSWEDLPDTPRTEAELLKLWNRTLVQDAVLPNVLPALSDFCTDLGVDAIRELTRSLIAAFAMNELCDWREALWQQQQWAFLLGSREPDAAPGMLGTWSLLPASRPLHLLPAPPLSDPDLPWDVFPSLNTICARMALTYAEWPRIGPPRDAPAAWPTRAVVALIESVEPASFEDADPLHYLATVVASISSAGDGDVDDAVADALVRMLRRAVRAVPLDVLARHRDLLGDVLHAIGASRLLFLNPGALTGVDRELVARTMAAPSTHVLVLPRTLLTPADNASGVLEGNRAYLNDDDALALLQAVVGLDDGGPTGIRPALTSALAMHVVKHVPAERIDRVLGAIADVPMVRAHGRAGEDDVLVSWRAVSDARKRDLLFGVGSQVASTLDIAEALQRALGRARILRIDWEAADALFRVYLPDCTPRSAAEAVLATDDLGAVSDRVSLLQVLLSDLLASMTGESRPALDDSRVQAVRYLLHGEPAHRYDPRSLLADDRQRDTDAWEKLARAALQVPGQAGSGELWRFVPEDLAVLVPQALRAVLGLGEVGPVDVLALIVEAGPERVDCSMLDESERDVVLRDFPEDAEETLKQLRIHVVKTSDDGTLTLTAIGPSTYLEPDGFSVDPLLVPVITIVRASTNRVVEARQRRIVDRWTGRAALTVALDQAEPWRFALPILRAFGDIRWQDLSGEHRHLLTVTPWLARSDGRGAAPADVLEIKGMEALIGPIVAASGEMFADRAALKPEVVSHSRYEERVVPEFQPRPDAVLAALAQLIDDSAALAHYRIGYLGLTSATLQVWQDVMRQAPGDLVPVVPLVEQTVRCVGVEACTAALLPALQRPIEPCRLGRILSWLVEQDRVASGARRDAIRATFNRFLEALAVQATMTLEDVQAHEEIVSGLTLLSAARSWRPIEQLCPPETNGIDADSVVDRDQGRILTRLLRHLAGSFDVASAEDHGDEPVLASADVTSAMLSDEASAELLRRYFESWAARCPRSMIAGLLGLLADGPIRELAESYFDNRGLTEAARGRLAWKAPRPSVTYPGWGASERVAEVMRTQRFAVSVLDPRTDDSVPVRNLLGTLIQVPVTGRPEHLLVGDRIEHPLVNQSVEQLRRTRLQFRRVRLDDLTEGELKRLLMRTGQLILEYVYLQEAGCDRDYWAPLSEGEQRDIRIAQIRLTEAMFTHVRQLGLAGAPELQEILIAWDAAGRRLAELDDAQTEELQRQRRQAEEQLRRLRRQLAERLDADASLQQTFLTSVRERVQAHFQYQRSSIPFELFQNADDAVVELADMRGIPVDVVAAEHAAARLIVDGEGLTLLHWGRPINRFLDVGFDGRARGYDADLEKMLTMTGSDKGRFSGQVTGRFGLGFKSVFLLTDRPEVVSGRIAFDVVGGLYPRYLPDGRRMALQAQLAETTAGAAEGTAIHLPTSSESSLHEATARFTQLAPVLTVFSRAIKRVELTTPQRSGVVSWQEHPLAEIPSAALGRLIPFDGVPTPALVLRGSRGALLFALGTRGVTALPDDIPTIWVTAPTGEDERLGFAVNAPFQLDVGRAQLARDSASNRQAAETLGTELAIPFRALARATAADWPAARARLGLAPDASAYEFWSSIWCLVAAGLRPSSDVVPASEAAMLARRVFWGTTESAFVSLVGHHDVVPTGLQRAYRTLTGPRQIRLHLAGCLVAEKRHAAEVPFEQVAAWPGVQRQAPPGAVVARETEETLRALSPTWDQSVPLTLATVLGWEVEALQVRGDRPIVGASAARRLGEVITRDLLRGLRESEPETPVRVEDASLRALLTRLSFQVASGGVAPAAEIVVGVQTPAIDNDDEHLRAAFAPPRFVLHASYTSAGAANALEFFLACRSVSAPVAASMAPRLAAWIREADADRRPAAVRYLACGEHRAAVAAALLPDVQRIDWLRTLPASTLFAAAGLNEWQRKAVLAALHLEVEQQPLWPLVPTPPPPIDPYMALRDIAAWWERDGAEHLSKYLQQTFPGGQAFALSADPARIRRDESVRKEWLKLFLLGATFTMGRQRREQHLAFLTEWEQAGWLDTFARPQLDPHEILGLLRAHLNSQVDAQRYYHWLRLFVPLVQLASWLDDYAGLFVQVTRGDQPVQSTTLLAPGVAPELSGSGIQAPALRRTLGIGVCFVAREVARAGIGTGRGLDRLCYVPTGAVRWLMDRLQCDRLEDSPTVEGSVAIHEHLVHYLGEDEARFGGSFDIPLLIVAEAPALRQRFLQTMPGEPELVSRWDELDVQDEDVPSPAIDLVEAPWDR